MIKVISSPQRPLASRTIDENVGKGMHDLIPDEWSTAAETLKAINEAGGPLSEGGLRALVGTILPIAGGAGIGWAFLPTLSAQSDSVTGVAMAIMGALVAFGGLIVGFVVNLMLVTGKIEHPEGMTYELLCGSSARVKYLLSSQATTLFSALIMSAIAIVWMLCRACSASNLALHIIGSVLAGFTALTFLRMFLLPLQIFELHEASLADGLEMKRLETNRNIQEGKSKE